MAIPSHPVPAGERLLEARGIVKAYGRAEHSFVAIRDVDLEVRSGEFVCLLGPSGCGKSTLLRIVTGLNAPTAGEVLYRGTRLDGVNPHATIVFQTFALYPWLTVQENVELALKAQGAPAAEREPRARSLIDTVGLDGFESAYPRELSGGMRQKVGFARAMAVEPELLCLDEPFSALDVLSAEALRGELMELWQNHALPTKAILMVTHSIEEAVLLADRIVVMGKDPGHVVTEIAVPLRHPRRRKEAAFQALVDRVYGAVAGRTPADAVREAAIPAGPFGPRLATARPNAVAGLVEKLKIDGGQVDLYRLAAELNYELDDLLPIVEAGELLGLVTVHEGDLLLAPPGETYADATIRARKELVGGRLLRLPVIRWVFETLQRHDDQRLMRDFFLEELATQYGDFAENQLDAVISWGRFAELFAFDDDTDELYLE